MSSFFNKLKAKAARKSGSHEKAKTQPTATTDQAAATSTSNQEGSYSIQPHPAKTNDPADLQRERQAGLQSNNPMAAHHARDPHIPSQQIQQNLEEPLSREELHARAAELNK